ncbi:hypothetical protein V8C37DRAFT_30689 [Trichoderma ceciliae]
MTVMKRWRGKSLKRIGPAKRLLWLLRSYESIELFSGWGPLRDTPLSCPVAYQRNPKVLPDLSCDGTCIFCLRYEVVRRGALGCSRKLCQLHSAPQRHCRHPDLQRLAAGTTQMSLQNKPTLTRLTNGVATPRRGTLASHLRAYKPKLGSDKGTFNMKTVDLRDCRTAGHPQPVVSAYYSVHYIHVSTPSSCHNRRGIPDSKIHVT